MGGIRPGAKSPLVSLAARLVKAPQWVNLLDPLLALLERDPSSSPDIPSFLHVVDRIRCNPERIEALLQHAFNDSVHQAWADAVLKEARQLDASLPGAEGSPAYFETELRDSMYHCCGWWYKTELDRLSSQMPLEGDQLAWYHHCMQQFQSLKQKRIETKPG